MRSGSSKSRGGASFRSCSSDDTDPSGDRSKMAHSVSPSPCRDSNCIPARDCPSSASRSRSQAATPWVNARCSAERRRYRTHLFRSDDQTKHEE
jgi:hypothetical protein